MPERRLLNVGQSNRHIMSQHMFRLIKACECQYGCVIDDQKWTKANEKGNICESKWYLIRKIE